MSSYNYHVPPTPIRPVDHMRKYFYTILFIKSYVYNIKGQAIIFRRKSLESLMKLLNDFDETYLHSSYEHSYQNKVLSEGNVDFLVKYTDHLDEVISLIDQNAYTVKLSWQPARVPQPFPPQPAPPQVIVPGITPPPPMPPIHPMPPPPPPLPNIEKLVHKAIERAIFKNNNERLKRVKIVKVHKDTNILEVRLWDDVNKRFLSMLEQVNVGAYSGSNVPDWRLGDDALLLDGKYLQRINDTPNYRRVKVTRVDRIAIDGHICVREFDDTTKSFIGNEEWIDLRAYCYNGKVPAWHVNDDALLFDNKYLQKLDVPLVTEGTVNIIDRGLDWGDVTGENNYGPNPYYDSLNPVDDEGTDHSQGPQAPYDQVSGTVPNSSEDGFGDGSEYGYDYDDDSYVPSTTPTSGCPCNNNTTPSGDNSGSTTPSGNPQNNCPNAQNPYQFPSAGVTPDPDPNDSGYDWGDCGCGG